MPQIGSPEAIEPVVPSLELLQVSVNEDDLSSGMGEKAIYQLISSLLPMVNPC